MDTKIVKSTSKGQITLPKSWRSQFSTDDFLLDIDEPQIIVNPVKIKKTKSEAVIFDANKDNEGQGVPIEQMIKVLKQVKKHG